MQNFKLLNSSGPWTLFLSIVQCSTWRTHYFLQASTAGNYFSGFIDKGAGTQFSLETEITFSYSKITGEIDLYYLFFGI